VGFGNSDEASGFACARQASRLHADARVDQHRNRADLEKRKAQGEEIRFGGTISAV
jgi:hypothetical protein